MKAVLAILTVPAATRLQMAPAKHPSEMDKSITPQLSAPRIRQYHEPPQNVDYADNSSVFGAILRGETRSLTLKETTNVLAFQDRSPRAPFHALVIPKKLIKNVFGLDQKDLPLVEEMHGMAADLLQSYQPDALLANDYILCYHVPPFNSVEHLHLHVLAPASEMKWLFRFTKYLPGTRWCTGGEQVRQRLKDGKKAVPFRHGGS
jgi:diadenosine tetraphosphate (Ap4A) HIT family hydrolase